MRHEVCLSAHPTLSGKEREFFDYWLANVVDSADPHLQDWVDYEEGAVERARDRTSLLELYTPVSGKRVLEVGCQNGAWLVALREAGAEPVGIDVVEPAVKAAAVRASCWNVDVDARVGDACSLAFADNSFDLVASSDVIEHVPDKRAMVREVMRVLRPGGIAVISAPQRFSVKHLLSDPHYGYAGVSFLPTRLATWYLTNLRGEAVYEVETLPTGAGVRRMFRREGGTVIGSKDGVTATPRIHRRLLDELRQGFTIVATK